MKIEGTVLEALIITIAPTGAVTVSDEQFALIGQSYEGGV